MTGTRRELALIFPFYFALAILFTWPLVARIHSHVPVTGDEASALSGLYTLTWGIHALAQQPLHYFQCNVLYPHADPLAYGEPLFGMAVALAPVQWIFLNPTFTYNLAVLLSFVLAGVGAYLLARSITESVRAGLLAGLIYGFSAWRFSEIDRLDALALMGLPWVFLVGHLYLEMRTRRLIYLGAFFAVAQCATSTGSVLLLAGSSVIALAYSLYRQKRRHRVLFWRHRGHFAVAMIAFLLILSFFVKPWHDHAVEDGTSMGPAAAGITRSSNDVSQMGFLSGSSMLRPFHSPGYVALLLVALLALGVLKPRDGDDHRIYFYGFLGGVALMAGAALPLDVGAILSLSAAILAAVSYGRIETLLSSSRTGNAIVTAVLVVLALELYPSEVRMAVTVPRQGPPAEYLWLSETDPESVILELPAAGENATSGPTLARRQLYSVYHWRRTVDGAMIRVPPLTRTIRSRLGDFPDDASIAQIHSLHVDWLIVHRNEYETGERDRLESALAAREEIKFERAFGETAIYRVE